MFQLKEIIIHYRNICQHAHDDNIYSVIDHFYKRIIKNYKSIVNTKDCTEDIAREQLVFNYFVYFLF